MSRPALLEHKEPLELPPPASPEAAAAGVHLLLRAVGEDPEREGLRRTPERVARAMSFLTSGYRKSMKDVLNGAIFRETYHGVVTVRDIEFYSLCEHHLLPFHGKAHVAYYPEGRVLGLSKLPRLLDVFARRLQVQERLTEQVAEAIREAIHPRGVAVLIEAAHFCMMMRGVEKQHSRTVTSTYLGCFEERPDLRQEFLASVRPEAAPSMVMAASPAAQAGPDAQAHDPRPPRPTSPWVPAPAGGHPAQYGAFPMPPSPAGPGLYGTGPSKRHKSGKRPRGHRCGQCLR